MAKSIKLSTNLLFLKSVQAELSPNANWKFFLSDYNITGEYNIRFRKLYILMSLHTRFLSSSSSFLQELRNMFVKMRLLLSLSCWDFLWENGATAISRHVAQFSKNMKKVQFAGDDNFIASSMRRHLKKPGFF